jgi:hypothetical protein
MSQCTHPGCPGEALAKGLCARHYMRLLRHGDPGTVKKAGRKSGWRAHVQQTFAGSSVSKRSLDRYVRAIRLLNEHGIDSRPFIVRATRANGSMNMLKLEREAQAVVENDDE